MSDRTSNLALPFLAAGQAQKHVTVNETLLRLDAILQLAVESATTMAQPSSPTDGDVYILPAGKSGADWSTMADHALAYYRDGVWEEVVPQAGWLAYVRDIGFYRTYDGAHWAPLGPGAVFKATMPADQVGVPNGVWTKIAFGAEAFDRNGDYDAANARHVPTSAHPVELTARLQWTTNAVAGQLVGIAIMKNGAFLATEVAAVTLSGNMAMSVSALDIPNGTTDYYEVAGILVTGGAGGTVKASGSIFYGICV